MSIFLWKRSKSLPALSLRIGAILLFPFVIGCGGGSRPGESPEAAHIGKIAQLITEFKSANSGNNPKNLDELKNWAVKNGKGDDPDFVSTRDKEPYVIEHQAMSRGGATAASRGPLIVHEAKGKNGMKFVVGGAAPIGSEMSDEGLHYLTRGPTDKKTR